MCWYSCEGERKLFYSQWKCEHWVNKLHLTFHDWNEGPLGSDPWMRMRALVVSCLTKMRWEKVLKNLPLTWTGGAIMAATVSAETHRHPSCWGGGRRARGRSECPSCIQICQLGSYTCLVCVSQPRESVKLLLNSLMCARREINTVCMYNAFFLIIKYIYYNCPFLMLSPSERTSLLPESSHFQSKLTLT